MKMANRITLEAGDIPGFKSGRTWQYLKEIGLEILRRQLDIDAATYTGMRQEAEKIGQNHDLVFGPQAGVRTGLTIVTSTLPRLAAIRSKNILIPAYLTDYAYEDVYGLIVGVFIEKPGSVTGLKNGCTGAAPGFVRRHGIRIGTRNKAGSGIPGTGKGTTITVPVSATYPIKILRNNMIASCISI